MIFHSSIKFINNDILNYLCLVYTPPPPHSTFVTNTENSHLSLYPNNPKEKVKFLVCGYIFNHLYILYCYILSDYYKAIYYTTSYVVGYTHTPIIQYHMGIYPKIILDNIQYVDITYNTYPALYDRTDPHHIYHLQHLVLVFVFHPHI